MLPHLEIHLFGAPTLAVDRVPVTRFHSAKVAALLYYLAATHRTQTRESLATLLWTDLPADQARKNLRGALYHVPAALEPFLEVTRDAVTLHLPAPDSVDSVLFAAHLHAAERLPPATAERAALLEDAARLYRGELLQGFSVYDAEAFDEWLRGEREHFRMLAMQTLNDLVVYHANRRDDLRAVDHASRLLTLDPLREETHRHLMLLLARSGQQSAAVAHYRTCQKLLADELGAAPDVETTELYHRILAGEFSRQAEIVLRSPEPVAPRHNLPAALTPFVGRAAEVAQARGYLLDPTVRLVTIAGLGGAGKTRLALEAASSFVASAQTPPPDSAGTRAPQPFPDGVWFVPLADLEPAAEVAEAGARVAHAVAVTLQVPLTGAENPAVQLDHALADKQLLIILDNFEHLAAAAPALLTLLQGAPGLKLLLTSQGRTNLRGEQIVPLSGLDLPTDAAESDSAEEFAASPAARLFLQTARTVAPHFEIDPPTQAAVMRICRLVQGLPLAIELAAAWARLLSCQEIADEVQNNLDFLESAGAAGADQTAGRQRSLRAVFLHSWRLLTPIEQQALRRLAIFRGGCTRAAAIQVTGATLTHLAALADKALLRTTAQATDPGTAPQTRYELQDVLRQFATEHLAEAGEADELAARHAAYFRAWLAAQEPALRGAGQQAAVALIGQELENVRSALRWHVQRLADPATAELPDLWPAFAAAFHFLDLRSWFQEGEALFREAAAALVPTGHTSPTPGAPARLWALLSARQGWFAFHLAHSEESVWLLRTGLERLLADREEHAAVFNYIYLGAVYRHQGRLDAAEEALHAALRIAQAHGDAYESGSAWNILGQVALLRGDLTRAQTCCRRALQIKREIGDRWGMTYALTYLGRTAQALGSLDEAAALFEESVAIYRALGDRRGMAFSAANLADVARRRGDYARAASLYRESLALYRAIGQRMEMSLTLTRLAAVHLADDEQAAAAADLRAALATARAIQSAPAMAAGLLGWAELAVRRGESGQALSVLAALHVSSVGGQELQDRARGLLAAVAGTEDLVRLPTRPFAELVDEILAEP